MSKLIKAILASVYSALIIELLRTYLIEKDELIIQINYILKTPWTLKRLNRETKRRKNISIDFNYTMPARLPTDLKFILKYTEAFSYYSSSAYVNGQQAFIEANCTYYNCYLTNDKSLLHDLRNFDAILFDVENDWDAHPFLRSPHQKYIFTASESADFYPVCHPHFENYYNWTWTYKLDSDIPWIYITIYDKFGKHVGPQIDMKWIKLMNPILEDEKEKLRTKKRVAAWFVSNCLSKSGRENVTRNIQRGLSKYGQQIDIYGFCGNYTCSPNRMEHCLQLLEKEYYFYLSFENSLSEDYVTEKLFYPLKYNTVPIVFGGADYSRFLPPDSYVDAGKLDGEAVASLIIESISDKDLYYRYFSWHNHYEYRQSPEVPDVCTLCRLLNENQTHSVVENFRHWWNPKHKHLCKSELNETVVYMPIYGN